jgi:iron-sulfur cluster repair protein YtfE (RIC family)
MYIINFCIKIYEIRYFVEKVYTKHKDKYAYLTELATVYKILEEDLLSHLPKEENVIFPYGSHS